MVWRSFGRSSLKDDILVEDDNEGGDWSEAILTSLEELAPQDDTLGRDDNMGHNDRIFMLLQLQEEKFW